MRRLASLGRRTLIIRPPVGPQPNPISETANSVSQMRSFTSYLHYRQADSTVH